MRISSLRVGSLRAPLAVDESRPRLSWRLGAGLGAETVRLLRVTVQRDTGGEAWAAVLPPSALAVRMDPVLETMTAYRWTVTAETDDGTILAQASSDFETGPGAGGWVAHWIARDPERSHDAVGEPCDPPSGVIPRSWQTMYAEPPSRFRRSFRLEGSVRRARLHISAHGVYRAFLNGERVGDDELAPGWTRYQSHLEYRSHDVTALLRDGENVVAAVVADGWWAGRVGYDTRAQAKQYGSRPELIAQLVIDHHDGRRTVVATDGGWQERAGEIVMSDLLMGEHHEPALATPGWDAPGDRSTGWRDVVVAGDDTSALRGDTAEPVGALLEIAAQTIRCTDDRRCIVDFGQNLVGRVRLVMRDQPAGRIVRLRHGEMLDGGDVYTANLRSAEATDAVVTTGAAVQVFEPWFTLHGFRYAEITGLTTAPAATDVTAVVLGSRLEEAGGFETGSELVNRLQANIVWSQRGNYVAVPTDCPQRDERLGWTADTQVFARTAVFNFDVKAFLRRWLSDLAESQDEHGRLPDVVPEPPRTTGFATAAPGWGDAAVIVPWALYEEYGDADLLHDAYPTMRAWVEWVASNNPDDLWSNAVGNDYGDWLSVDEHTPHRLVAGAYRIRSVDLLSRTARVLGRTEDAEHYARAGVELRALFRTRFLRADGTLEGDTQSAYLFALAWDLVDEADRDGLARRLVTKLEERGRRLTTGFLGVGLLAPVLTAIGRTDLAMGLVLQRAYPSWGYSIDLGATTIWERWDGWTEHAGFQDMRMNSFNHYSLGSIGEWLYRSVGGIDQRPGSIGYRHLRVAPVIAAELSPVRAWHDTVHGRVEVEWRLDGEQIVLHVTVPPGSDAEIVLPGAEPVIVGSGRHTLVGRLDGIPAEGAVAPAPASRGSGAAGAG